MGLRTRGMNLSDARAFVKERFEDTGWNALVARLPPADVAEVWGTLILPNGWYDIRVHATFLDAMEAEFRAAAPDLGRELGHRAAQSDIKFHHSQTMAFTSPLRVLEQCARLWEEHYSEGRLEVEDRGTQALKIGLVNPGVHRMVCREILPAWGEHAVRHAGAERARVEKILCVHDGFSRCEYVVEWG